jgi:hypothetical protein
LYRYQKAKTQLKVVALSVLVATSVHAKESEDMYFGLGAVQTKFGGDEVSSVTKRGITYNEVTEAYRPDMVSNEVIFALVVPEPVSVVPVSPILDLNSAFIAVIVLSRLLN